MKPNYFGVFKEFMEKDKLILAHLRKDARLSLTKMSRKINVPVSTIHERMKAYKGKYVRKHTALLDFESLGFNARAKVLLKVGHKDREKLREFLCGCQYINELIKVNNGYDFLVEFVFRQMRELEGYLGVLGNRFDIKDERVFYVVDELKKESFMSSPCLERIGKFYK